MLGVAIRIAQRMGIHSELALAKCTPLEAEMCRRLWWSLVLFDTRIGELADSKTTTLTPAWDCRVPLNVSDSDLFLEMKEPPQIQGTSTEALFTVVRSELGNFIRHTVFHLGFTCPGLKPLARDGPESEGSGLDSLEKMIEERYLKFCDPENPLHFMTIWTTRGYIAKCRFMEHCFRYPTPSTPQAIPQHDAALSYAMTMLQCDTKLMTSPLTKGFRWFTRFYLPFPAYIRIAQILQRQPISDKAEQAWEVMSNNYEARFHIPPGDNNPFFRIFSKIILQAWVARETLSKQTRDALMTPRIVQSIRRDLAHRAPSVRGPEIAQPNTDTDMAMDDLSMTMQIGFDNTASSNNTEGIDSLTGIYPDIPGFTLPDLDINQIDWFAMDWGLANVPPDESLPQFQRS